MLGHRKRRFSLPNFTKKCWRNSSVVIKPNVLQTPTFVSSATSQPTSTNHPDKLGPEHIRLYQAYLFQSKKLSLAGVSQYVSALRFLFIKTLGRHFLTEHIPFPKSARRLPVVLRPEEVARLIDAARNLYHRTLLMTLYSTAKPQTLPSQGQRHRQSAHDDVYYPRQMWPGSRSAAQSDTARDLPSPLALDET